MSSRGLASMAATGRFRPAETRVQGRALRLPACAGAEPPTRTQIGQFLSNGRVICSALGLI